MKCPNRKCPSHGAIEDACFYCCPDKCCRKVPEPKVPAPTPTKWSPVTCGPCGGKICPGCY